MESERQQPRYLVCFIYHSEEWFFHVDSLNIPILNLKNISLGMNLSFLDYVNTANIALVQGDYECYDETLLSELPSLNFLVIIRPIVCHEHPAPARRLHFGDESAYDDELESENDYEDEDGSEEGSDSDGDEGSDSDGDEGSDSDGDDDENDEVVAMDEAEHGEYEHGEDEHGEYVNGEDDPESKNEPESDENELDTEDELEYDLEQEFQLLMLEQLQEENGEMPELVSDGEPLEDNGPPVDPMFEEYVNNAYYYLENVALPMDAVVPDQDELDEYHDMPALVPDLPDLQPLPIWNWNELPPVLPAQGGDEANAELPEVHWADPGFMGANNQHANLQPFAVNFNDYGGGEGDPIIIDEVDEDDNDWRGDNDYIPPENLPENDIDIAVRGILNQNDNFQNFLDEHGYANNYNHLGGLANLLVNDNIFRGYILNNNLLDNRLMNVYVR